MMTIEIDTATLPKWVRWIAFDASGALYCYARKPKWNAADLVYEAHPADNDYGAIYRRCYLIIPVANPTACITNARATLSRVRKV